MPSGERSRRVLVEDFHFVGSAVSVGIFEDRDAVAFIPVIRLLEEALAIVHRFGDPNAPALVNVEVGWVDHVGFRRPQSDLKAVSHAQAGNGVFGCCLSFQRRRAQDRHQAQEGEAKSSLSHAQIVSHRPPNESCPLIPRGLSMDTTPHLQPPPRRLSRTPPAL